MSFWGILKGKTVKECEKELDEASKQAAPKPEPQYNPPVEPNWVHEHGDYRRKYVCHCGHSDSGLNFAFGESLCPGCGCISKRTEEVGRYEWECDRNYKWSLYSMPSRVVECRPDVRNYHWVKKPDGACGKDAE